MTFWLITLLLAQAPDADALKRTVAVEAAALERSPDDVDALYRLGLAYLALGDAKRAIKPLESLAKKDPESLDAQLLLARAYRAGGEVDKAKSLLEKAITSRPDEVSLRAERAGLARSQDDFETAVAQYTKAVELSPQDAGLRFNLGEALHKGGRSLDGAIAAYREALKIDADLSQAKINLGKALAEKGLFGEAKELLQSVNRTALVDAEAHYNLGVIYMRENNVTSAVTEFERTVAVQPKHPQALNNLGVAYDARADEKKALEYFRKASLADPTFAEAFFNMGMSHMKLGRPNEATKAFEQALKLEPASSSPYVKLGTLYLQQGKKDRAVEAFKKALAAMDDEEKKASGFKLLTRRLTAERSTDAYRGLALAFLSQGKVDDAVATLKQAVDKMPKDASAREALGDTYLAQGKYDEAVEQLKERLSLESSTEAKLDLATAYTKKRVAKEAEPLLKEVMKAEPENRAARIGLVDLYISMGRLADAETLLKAALATDSNDAQALARLGIMKARLGRPNEALEPLEKAVQLNPALSEARAEYAFLLVRGDPSNADRCVNTMSDILVNEPRNALALTYLGFCLIAKGDKSKAEQSLKAAIGVDSAFGPAHYFLGQLYETSGKMEEAKKAYQASAAADYAPAKDELKRLGVK